MKTFGGPPDILINNLGVGNPYGLEEQTDEGWAKSFQVNFMGSVRICRGARAADGGARLGVRRAHRLRSREAA